MFPRHQNWFFFLAIVYLFTLILVLYVLFILYPLGTRTTHGPLYPCRTIKHKKTTISTQYHVLFNRVVLFDFKHTVKSTFNGKNREKATAGIC